MTDLRYRVSFSMADVRDEMMRLDDALVRKKLTHRRHEFGIARSYFGAMFLLAANLMFERRYGDWFADSSNTDNVENVLVEQPIDFKTGFPGAFIDFVVIFTDPASLMLFKLTFGGAA